LEEEHDESKVLINPKVLNKKGHTKYWEACASCLNNMGLVSRPYKLKIKYIDIDKKKHIKTFTGFEATVLSHELDHLNGILHIDIAEKIIKMPKNERKAFREKHPYEIISKDCDYEEIWNKINN
jgi:peptide deformylase